MKLLKDIIYGVRIIEIKGNTNIAVENIAFDSREINNLSLFIALKGVSQDGHNFISQALNRGACAIICESLPEILSNDITYIKVSDSSKSLGIVASNFFDNPSEKLKLVGITGTNGKTTCATLLYDLYRLMGYSTGLISTVHIKILHKTIPATHTTPNAIRINELLSQMVIEGCSHVFMEVSSHALDQNRVSGLSFDIGVYTNISRDHLDYHPTLNDYIGAKKKLFNSLKNDALAIVNFDDPYGEEMLRDINAKPFSYGLKGDFDFKGKIVENNISGLSVEIDGFEMTSRLIGEFNAYNLLVVFAVAKSLGEEALTVLKIISNLKAPDGRFEYIVSPTNITAVIDYAHTPDALENVLKTLVSLKSDKEKIFTVFGCGGDRDKGKRPLMGEISSVYSDRVIVTSDNPRSEKPSKIIKDIISGIPKSKSSKVLTIQERKEAIKVACELAESGDVILIAGKGHEKYQIIGDEKLYFDDLETTIEIFKQIQQ
jgi:UDP-N-acetylmuramoyl-L-alanyl-D-glutamate--2,6-diaminopimelate ligase